jgi:hypothetical protein
MFCAGIERAVLLYECKDSQQLKEFYFKQDEAVLNPILSKIREVQALIKNSGDISSNPQQV